MRKIFTFLAFFTILCTLQAQNDTTRYKLDPIDLAPFKEEAEYKYKLFFESTLNIIDNNLDTVDRKRSMTIMNELFQGSTSTITDILYSLTPTVYTPYAYSFELFKGAHELPLLYKRFKYSESLDFKLQGSKGMDQDKDNNFFNIYVGEMFVLETLIKSRNIPASLLNKPTFNAYEEGLVKKIKFRIGHNSEKEYELKISSIDILPRNNTAYDYKDKVKEIEKSSYKWSDQSEEEYLASLTNKAIEKGILPPLSTIDIKTQSLMKKEINIVFKKDTLKYSKPGLIDYALPGYGHIRYGLNDNTRLLKTITYGSLFIGSSTFAIISKIKSEKSYSLHKDASTFRSANREYERANRNHKKFVVSTGIAVGTLIANAIHLNFSHKKQINKINQAKKNKGISSDQGNQIKRFMPVLEFGEEMSLIWKF